MGLYRDSGNVTSHASWNTWREKKQWLPLFRPGCMSCRYRRRRCCQSFQVQRPCCAGESWHTTTFRHLLAGRHEEHPDYKKYWVMQWLSVWSEMQMICIWSSWCHCHAVISCFIKIQPGLTFLVPAYPGCSKKRPLNGCLPSDKQPK